MLTQMRLQMPHGEHPLVTSTWMRFLTPVSSLHAHGEYSSPPAQQFSPPQLPQAYNLENSHLADPYPTNIQIAPASVSNTWVNPHFHLCDRKTPLGDQTNPIRSLPSLQSQSCP